MSDAATVREHITNLLAGLLLAAVVVSVAAWAWPDARAGWLESARVRASLVGQP